MCGRSTKFFAIGRGNTGNPMFDKVLAYLWYVALFKFGDDESYMVSPSLMACFERLLCVYAFASKQDINNLPR